MNLKEPLPVPTSLAGYQLLCDSTIQFGDLCVPEWALTPSDWYVAGKPKWPRATDANGCRGLTRVYRKSSPPQPGDNDTIPGSNPGQTYGERRETLPVPPHSSAFGLAPTTAAADEFRKACSPPTAAERKALPLATGVLDYFPDALLAVAACSRAGNDQHNPGQPLHWDRAKSTDEADALARHFIDRGNLDTDGIRHSAKVAWRALALLQKEIEGTR